MWGWSCTAQQSQYTPSHRKKKHGKKKRVSRPQERAYLLTKEVEILSPPPRRKANPWQTFSMWSRHRLPESPKSMPNHQKNQQNQHRIKKDTRIHAKPPNSSESHKSMPSHPKSLESQKSTPNHQNHQYQKNLRQITKITRITNIRAKSQKSLRFNNKRSMPLPIIFRGNTKMAITQATRHLRSLLLW